MVRVAGSDEVLSKRRSILALSLRFLSSREAELMLPADDPARPLYEPTPAERGLGGPATVRRALWGLVDQGVYSLTNFVLVVVIARSVSQQRFGAFAALLIVYVLTLGVSEALTAEVYTVTQSGGAPGASKSSLKSASGSALGMGLLVAALALTAFAVSSGPVASLLPPFAIVIPGLFLQDFWRYALFAAGRPAAALLNDLVWAVVQTSFLVILAVAGASSPSLFILAWGGGGLAGAVVGMFQVHLIPNPAMSWGFLREHRRLGPRFATEWLTLYGSAQLVLGLLGTTSGLAELASLRAAQIFFGPLQGLLSGVRLSLTSLAVRVREHRPGHLGPLTLAIGLGLGTIAAVWACAAVLLPDRLGVSLLGPSWQGARELVPVVAISQVAAALGLGALTALRALREARRSVRARTTAAALVFLFGSAGTLVGDAPGAALGVALATTIGLILLVWQARRALQDHASRQ